MNKFRLLLIDRDREMNDLFFQSLLEAGYEVQSAFNGTDGLWAAENGTFDAVILDLMLPFKNGEEILRQLKLRTSSPVLIFSTTEDLYKKVDLAKLEAEADAYIDKPLIIEEFILKIEETLRRSYPAGRTGPVLSFRGITLNRDACRITAGGLYIGVTAIEYRILETLLANPSMILTRSHLTELIQRETCRIYDNIHEILMADLMEKLKEAGCPDDLIKPVFKLGYRLYEEEGFTG